MDAHRFDSLARRVGSPTSRRSALGTAVASGVLGALGLSRAPSVVQAAQGQVCMLTFTSTVRTGANATQTLTPSTPPGVLQGELSFTLSETGNIEQGELLLSTGASVPVVGQATGHSMQIRVAIDPGVTLVAVGVGEQEIAACQGVIDGLVAGPAPGDLGDWHATAAPQDATAALDSSVLACPRGQILCDLNGGYCADLQTDVNNCGACGNLCAVNNCTNGVCREATMPVQNCPPPLAFCGGVCVDLQTDVFNCGACGNQCPVNNCTAGVCGGGGIQNCVSPSGLCSEGCIDLRSDVHNCGGCGVLCAFGEICTNGACVAGPGECEPGEVVCGSFCANLSRNIVNCGACGISCNADQICLDGVCTSDSTSNCDGLTLCDNVCVDITNDSLNCGWCGIACPPGEVCVNSNCAPLSGAVMTSAHRV